LFSSLALPLPVGKKRFAFQFIGRDHKITVCLRIGYVYNAKITSRFGPTDSDPGTPFARPVLAGSVKNLLNFIFFHGMIIYVGEFRVTVDVKPKFQYISSPAHNEKLSCRNRSAVSGQLERLVISSSIGVASMSNPDDLNR
jgi:hypothetical protein